MSRRKAHSFLHRKVASGSLESAKRRATAIASLTILGCLQSITALPIRPASGAQLAALVDGDPMFGTDVRLRGALDTDAGDFVFYVRRQSVDAFARNLSMVSGLPVVLYGDLSGTIENWSIKGRPIVIYAALAQRAHLFFAFDGVRVLLASERDSSPVLLDSGSRDAAASRSLIRSLFKVYPRDAVAFGRDDGEIIVRGPPPFVQSLTKLFARPATPTMVEIVRAGHSQDVKMGRGF